MLVLLCSLPGTPVLYYGDEIGMGDNILPRRPQRRAYARCSGSSDRNAGFSRANPQQLYLPAIIDPEYHYESLNVEALEPTRTRCCGSTSVSWPPASGIRRSATAT